MPRADGTFAGQGWSRHKEDAWTRVFGPALADDPDPDDEIETPMRFVSGMKAYGRRVPHERSDEVLIPRQRSPNPR